MVRPIMLVVAGPAGSGKTTAFPLGALGVDGFNIDDRCAQLLGSYLAIPRHLRAAVARECEQFVAKHIRDRRSFAVETTLRTLAAVRQAELAGKAGFRTEMKYLATSSPDVNVQRVLQRAQAGGHSATEGEVREVYAKSLANLVQAVRAFERCDVYDTSEPWSLPRFVATASSGRVSLATDALPWVVEALRLAH